MSEPGFPSKQPDKLPPIIIRGYEDQGAKTPAPSAAIFNKGVTNEAGIREATERRREHSRALSDPSRKGYEKQSRFS